MADLDLRRLRQFLVLADTLNYSRAAELLHLAQPALSRSIIAFERELGVRLFDRSRSGTSLTRAGELLRDEARLLLGQAEALQRRLLSAEHEEQSLTIGFLPGTILAPMIRHLEGEFPGLRVEGVRTSQADQITGLREGLFDAAVAVRPFTEQGLTVIDLYAEPRAAILPATHRCAGQEEVVLADLAEDLLLQPREAVPGWRGAVAPAACSVEEKAEMIAAGRGIVIVPESSARYYRHPDLTFARVADAPPAELCLVVESHRRSVVLRELIRNAQAVSNVCAARPS